MQQKVTKYPLTIFLRVWVFCLHICFVHHMHAVPSEALELKLQGFVSCHVGTRTELWFSLEQPVISARVIAPPSHQQF